MTNIFHQYRGIEEMPSFHFSPDKDRIARFLSEDELKTEESILRGQFEHNFLHLRKKYDFETGKKQANNIRMNHETSVLRKYVLSSSYLQSLIF